MNYRSFIWFTAYLVLFVFARLSAGATEAKPDAAPANLREIKRGALAVIEDVVPRDTAPNEIAKVTAGENSAFLGRFFGDEQNAALVAVKSTEPNQKTRNNADLCLLLWKDGWEFHQWVGKISRVDCSSQLYCEIKRHLSCNTYYVMARLSRYPGDDLALLSWFCDPKTNTLTRTGWSENRAHSIAGDTITFTGQEKPGQSPVIHEIHQFADQPGERIASFSVTYTDGHLPLATISVRDPRLGKFVTWRIWKRKVDYANYSPDHELYALCYSQSEKKEEPFHEDAVIDFNWGKYGAGDESAAEFLLWRLAGLTRNAIEGRWDQDGKNEIFMPKSVAVTGLPEAVQQFTWPGTAKNGEQGGVMLPRKVLL